MKLGERNVMIFFKQQAGHTYYLDPHFSRSDGPAEHLDFYDPIYFCPLADVYGSSDGDLKMLRKFNHDFAKSQFNLEVDCI
jgi:hypothetical protein